MAGDEGRAGIGRHGAFERGDQLFVVAAALDRGVDGPVGAVHQPVVRGVERLVHPDRLGDVDADGHVQFTTPLEQGLHTRVVHVDAFARSRTGVDVAEALVHQLTYTDGAQPPALLEPRDGAFGPSGLAEIRVVETAPEREFLLVGSVFGDDLLERAADPVAVHHVDPLDTHAVERCDPCADLGVGGGIVVRMGVDDREPGLQHPGFGDFEDRLRSVIAELQLLRGGLGGLRALIRVRPGGGRGASGCEERSQQQTVSRFHRSFRF